jgi:hypothetical protein
MLIEMFLEWIQTNQARLQGLGVVSIEVEKNPDWDNPTILHSARIIFWTQNNAGDITIWQAGHFDLLVYLANNDLLFSDSIFLEIEKSSGDEDGIGRKKIAIRQVPFEQILNLFFQHLIPNQP